MMEFSDASGYLWFVGLQGSNILIFCVVAKMKFDDFYLHGAQSGKQSHRRE
jgi:hypothetical protein